MGLMAGSCDVCTAAQVVELQPGNASAAASVRRLAPIVEKKREEMKEEMMGAHVLAAPWA